MNTTNIPYMFVPNGRDFRAIMDLMNRLVHGVGSLRRQAGEAVEAPRGTDDVEEKKIRLGKEIIRPGTKTDGNGTAMFPKKL